MGNYFLCKVFTFQMEQFFRFHSLKVSNNVDHNDFYWRVSAFPLETTNLEKSSGVVFVFIGKTKLSENTPRYLVVVESKSVVGCGVGRRRGGRVNPEDERLGSTWRSRHQWWSFISVFVIIVLIATIIWKCESYWSKPSVRCCRKERALQTHRHTLCLGQFYM